MSRFKLPILAGAFLVAGTAIALFCLQTVPRNEPSINFLLEQLPSSEWKEETVVESKPDVGSQYAESDDATHRALRAENQRQHDLLAAENAGTLNVEIAAQALALEKQPEYLTPLILRTPQPSVTLDETEKRTLETVRQSFNAAMAKAGDPSSPEYLDRWLVEQERADELLTAYLGVESIGKLGIPFDPSRNRQQSGRE